jgi:phage-related protein
MEIIFFNQDVEDFFNSLEKPTRRKIWKVIRVLESLGFDLSMPFSKKIDNKLYELRTLGRPQVRVFYTYYDNKWVLLYGFVKKTMRIPWRELNVAKNRMSMLD